MINKLIIQQRLSFILTYLLNLQKKSNLPKKEFLANQDTIAATESYLRRTLEAVFDIGRHILAKNSQGDLATEYKSIPKGLLKLNIISKKTEAALIEMAGYRNRLVHLYHLVSDEELYEIIQQDLGDIQNFVDEIKDYLQKI